MQGKLSSYQRILWTTSVVGGATLASLVIGLARNKVVALLGGPAAIGLLGLFMSLVSMGASVATLGLDTSAVRQIGQQSGNRDERARIQRALWTIAWPLAFLGAGALWLFRDLLAVSSAGDARYATAVGWLSIGVGGSVIAAIQISILQAHGRIGDLARVRLWSSVLATAFGIAAVYLYGLGGIVVAVVAQPLTTCLFALWLSRSLPGSNWSGLFQARLSDQWWALISLGAVVTATNFVNSFSQLGTRALVTRALGLEATGFYHACWSITWVNLSLVLNAMAADYFPRISEVSHEPESISEILNQQVHVALMFAGPALVFVSAFAPLVLTVLYSSAFSGSALLLRLLIIAGVVRLPIWALGYVLLARRDAISYFMGEVAGASIIPLTWLLLPVGGLTGAGIAALLSGLAILFVYFVPVHRSHGVKLSSANLRLILTLVVILIGLSILFELNRILGEMFGLLSAIGLGWRLIREVRVAFGGKH